MSRPAEAGRRRTAAAAQQRAQEALGRMGGQLAGALGALRTVRASGAEDRMADGILRDADEAARFGIAAVRREAVASTIASAGVQVAIVAVLGIGAWRIGTGDLEVATLVAFLLYSFNLLGPVMGLASEITTLQSGIAAAARIREVESLPPEPTGRLAIGHRERESDEALVRLSAVTARYLPDGEPAVRRLDLAIPPRGHTAIVGPSGAGKTTLMALLLRFLDPDGGELTLGGRPYVELAPERIRARFGYVEQDAPLVPGTIRDNLLLAAPDATDQAIRQTLSEVLLLPYVDGLPDGLDTVLSVGSMSGGQRQRIALARALLRKPDILLLDEATAQVDAITESAIVRCVRTHAADAAVVSIAHRLSTVLDADRIVVLDQGRVRAVGTHRQLVDSDELYRALVEALRIAETTGRPGDGNLPHRKRNVTNDEPIRSEAS